MAKGWRVFRIVAACFLLLISVLIIILMVAETIPKQHPECYVSKGIRPDIPVLEPLPADSLLNGGTLEELDRIPGIGVTLAGRIIELREYDGFFYFPEDVIAVKGIGEKRAAEIKAYMEALAEAKDDSATTPDPDIHE